MADERPVEVVEGDVVDAGAATLAEVMPRPLQYPPAVRTVCACFKNGTPEAHGLNPRTGHRALTCEEVLAVWARQLQDSRRGFMARLLDQIFWGTD